MNGANSQPNFIPYRLIFTPELGEMLSQVGLCSADDWTEYAHRPKENAFWGPLELHFLGAEGVVISRDSYGKDLVHWLGSNSYTREFGLRVDLDFLSFRDRIVSWSPWFFVSTKLNEIHIGIGVDRDWWTTEKQASHDGIVQTESYGLSACHLVFAKLPVNAFNFIRNSEPPQIDGDELRNARNAGWEVQFSPSITLAVHFKKKMCTVTAANVANGSAY